MVYGMCILYDTVKKRMVIIIIIIIINRSLLVAHTHFTLFDYTLTPLTDRQQQTEQEYKTHIHFVLHSGFILCMFFYVDL